MALKNDPFFDHASLVPCEFRVYMRCPAGQLPFSHQQASREGTPSTVTVNRDKFQACMDVNHFKWEEITVKASETAVIVEGKHEEEDKHGFILKHFLRKFVLPKGYDGNEVESKLSSAGFLTITVPSTHTSKEDRGGNTHTSKEDCRGNTSKEDRRGNTPKKDRRDNDPFYITIVEPGRPSTVERSEEGTEEDEKKKKEKEREEEKKEKWIDDCFWI